MDESWDQHAEGWDTNEDVILYSEKAYNALTGIVSPEDLNILDFGCGTGLLTARMAPIANRILALDSSDKMIAVLKNKQLRNVATLCAELSAETIEANDLLHSKFDLIVASSVCAFLPDYESTLQLLKTLLKSNGLFVQWDWLKTDDNSDFGFTEEIVESAFLKTGLEVSSITKAFSLERSEGSMPVLMGVAQNA